MIEIPSEKELLINAIKKNLAFKIIDVAELIKSKNDSKLENITFADIFDVGSITDTDSCLTEMVRHIEKMNKTFLSISEIQNILRCDKEILSKTISLLILKGGFGGYSMETFGQKRGKKYKLVEEKND